MADIGSHGKSEGGMEGALEPLRGNNIVLVGMRGTGKSTVAELLRIGIEANGGSKMRVIDTDAEIEKQEGMPIAELVKTRGEQAFREIEDKVVQHAAQQENVIIATGGGAVTRPENIQALRAKAFVVWLKADIPVLEARTRNDPNRFPLNDAKTLDGQMEQTSRERKEYYERAKDHVVDTSSLSADKVAKEIYHALEKRKSKKAA